MQQVRAGSYVLARHLLQVADLVSGKGQKVKDYQTGIEILKKMLGTERAESVIRKFRSLSPVFEKEVVSVVFGRTWARGTLDLKARSLCSIGILSSLGRLNALKINFTLAMENGASLEEIVEVLLQVAIYAGYPAALDALVLLDEVVKSIGGES
jgi:4-carboxymuconolactone decarboxylase